MKGDSNMADMVNEGEMYEDGEDDEYELCRDCGLPIDLCSCDLIEYD